MNLAAPISSIMTTNLATLSPDDTLADVEQIFLKHKIHHIPIVQDRLLKGMVSKSDFLLLKHGYVNEDGQKVVESLANDKTLVKQIMVKGIAKLEPSDRINTALEIFKENIFHAIPVVQNELLVGIVTTYDIIKALANEGTAATHYEYK